jgi:hypothetical protein
MEVIASNSTLSCGRVPGWLINSVCCHRRACIGLHPTGQCLPPVRSQKAPRLLPPGLQQYQNCLLSTTFETADQQNADRTQTQQSSRRRFGNSSNLKSHARQTVTVRTTTFCRRRTSEDESVSAAAERQTGCEGVHRSVCRGGTGKRGGHVQICNARIAIQKLGIR